MFQVSTYVNRLICLIECVAYMPIVATSIHRYKKCINHESWRTNSALRCLWYLQLVLVVNFFFASFLYTMLHCLDSSAFSLFIENLRYVLGQAWFYLFASIQLLLCLLVSRTVLMCRRKDSSFLKSYKFGFLIPSIGYMLNLPMFWTDENDTRITEYTASVLSNVGGLIMTTMTLFCTYWLVAEFIKLIGEINKYQYAKESNAKSISNWKRFLFANIGISSAIFLYSGVDNIDELFQLKLLSAYNYGEIGEFVEYSLTRLLNTVLKYVLSVILVFLSPYSSLKIKRKRRARVSDYSSMRKESVTISSERTMLSK